MKCTGSTAVSLILIVPLIAVVVIIYMMHGAFEVAVGTGVVALTPINVDGDNSVVSVLFDEQASFSECREVVGTSSVLQQDGWSTMDMLNANSSTSSGPSCLVTNTEGSHSEQVGTAVNESVVITLDTVTLLNTAKGDVASFVEEVTTLQAGSDSVVISDDGEGDVIRTDTTQTVPTNQIPFEAGGLTTVITVMSQS